MGRGRTIEVGVAGLGRSGWNLHVASLREHPDYRIGAVCDVRAAWLYEAHVALGCAAYSDFDELLRHPGLELVVVATPTRDHGWMSARALEAGLHVVLEKPLAASVEDAEALKRIADRAGRLLSPYYNYRFANDFVLIRSLLDRDLIGRPFLIRRQMGYFNRRDDWQSRSEEAGGILVAATIHFLDQVLQIAGEEPAEIWSDVRRVVSKGDAADHSKILLRFPGCVGDVEVSWGEALPGCEWLIYGARGAIRRQGNMVQVRWFAGEEVEMAPAEERSYLSGERIPWREERYEIKESFTTDYYDLLADAIRHGGPLPVSWESAMKTFRLLVRC